MNSPFHYFNSYREADAFLVGIGYSLDNQIDLEEDPHKREIQCQAYLQHESGEDYIKVTYMRTYDDGATDFTIDTTPLKRIETQVTVTKVVYEQQ
jgi:hypothetical protein